MFTDLKNIEEEINRFKSNLNSVDGLMSATKEVCGKMDHQINQADQVLASFSSFCQEQSQDMQIFTHQIANDISRIDERLTSNQQEVKQSLEKQEQELEKRIENLGKNQQLFQQSLEKQEQELEKRIENLGKNQQLFQQSLEKQEQKLEQLIENLVNNQQLFQQSLVQQNRELKILAEKAEARHRILTIISVAGFLALCILLILT